MSSTRDAPQTSKLKIEESKITYQDNNKIARLRLYTPTRPGCLHRRVYTGPVISPHAPRNVFGAQNRDKYDICQLHSSVYANIEERQLVAKNRTKNKHTTSGSGAQWKEGDKLRDTQALPRETLPHRDTILSKKNYPTNSTQIKRNPPQPACNPQKSLQQAQRRPMKVFLIYPVKPFTLCTSHRANLFICFSRFHPRNTSQAPEATSPHTNFKQFQPFL